MKKGKQILLIFIVFFFVFPLHVLSVEATCMRCKTDVGSDLACVGETKFALLSKCGSPDYSEETAEKTSGVLNGNVNLTTKKVELIYYNCGDGKNIKIIKVRGGKIVSIKDGDRGSGPERCW